MVYNITVSDIEKAGIVPETFDSQHYARNLGDVDSIPALKDALKHGYIPAVERAENYIRDLESKLETLPQTQQFEIMRSPFGGRVNMGEWMAGSPTPMRRKVKRFSEVAPVKIVVGNFVSYGVSASDYARRSEAIIALVLLVQRYRPIDLFCSIESTLANRKTPVFGLLKLESRPINLSQLGFIIGHPAFSRVWGFSWLQSKNVPSHIPFPPFSITEKRQILNLEPQDLYINSLGISDPLQSDPLAWILNEMQRLTGEQSSLDLD